MTSFRRYDHLERFGRTEVVDIDIGKVYVFPKLDGTNASVWAKDDTTIECGSRNRTLSADKDNAGFHAWVNGVSKEAIGLRDFLETHPYFTVYGEWLVPHSLKTYRDESWRRFWVFDVYDHRTQSYIRYDRYKDALQDRGVDVIPPLCTIDSPSQEQIDALLASNTFQIKDGEGAGEGVVIKNYEWKNRFGRQPWAKIVRNDFKELNAKEFGHAEKRGPDHVEQQIAERYVTKALVDKVRAKIIIDISNKDPKKPEVLVANLDGTPLQKEYLPEDYDQEEPDWKEWEQKNRGKVIPQLLHRVFYDVVNEDLWDALKRFKNPRIDFKRLQSFITKQVKELAEDLF
jgi:hypothetical protein